MTDTTDQKVSSSLNLETKPLSIVALRKERMTKNIGAGGKTYNYTTTLTLTTVTILYQCHSIYHNVNGNLIKTLHLNYSIKSHIDKMSGI